MDESRESTGGDAPTCRRPLRQERNRRLAGAREWRDAGVVAQDMDRPRDRMIAREDTPNATSPQHPPPEYNQSRGTAPLRTPPASESEIKYQYRGHNLVTGIREYRRELCYRLAPETRVFRVGARDDCDVMISGLKLSGLHCNMARRRNGIYVHDLGSSNQSFFAEREAPEFFFVAGDEFYLATTQFLALDDAMILHRPAFVTILGADDADASTAVNDLLRAATRSGTILITGELGCDQRSLAAGVHAVSLRRSQPLIEEPLPATADEQRAFIDRASRATLIIDLYDKQTMLAVGPVFSSLLFSSSYDIRIIVIAPTLDRVAEGLGHHALVGAHHVNIRSLRSRRGEIVALYDRFMTDAGAAFRFDQLTLANQATLERYALLANLEGLRAAAERLPAICDAPSQRQAAKLLGFAHSSFSGWITRVGIDDDHLLAVRDLEDARPRRQRG